MPKKREDMTYRWNEDLKRVEFFSVYDNVWYRSAMTTMGQLMEGTPVTSYDDTWCEPFEGMWDGQGR